MLLKFLVTEIKNTFSYFLSQEGKSTIPFDETGVSLL